MFENWEEQNAYIKSDNVEKNSASTTIVRVRLCPFLNLDLVFAGFCGSGGHGPTAGTSSSFGNLIAYGTKIF